MFAPFFVGAQIDPVKRDLIQFGYNQAFEGHAPLAGYAYYYHNQPDFLRTNLTLRLAVAPVYLDSELGFVRRLGPNTDFGIGLAGGGFARRVTTRFAAAHIIPAESSTATAGKFPRAFIICSIPATMIPLNFVLRGTAHYSAYDRNDDTAPDFQLPADHGEFSVRTGLRWGGVEPTLFPALAMELSVWYEGQSAHQLRQLRISPATVRTRRAIPFVLDGSRAGLHPAQKPAKFLRPPDRRHQRGRRPFQRLPPRRISAAHCGISRCRCPAIITRKSARASSCCSTRTTFCRSTKRKRWNLDANVASAVVDYLPGESQPGNWLNGVGGGILYHSPSDRWKIMLDYGYGIDAIRSHGRGANSIGMLMQMDLGKADAAEDSIRRNPTLWRGWQRHFRLTSQLTRIALRSRRGLLYYWSGAHMVELADTLL